MRLPSTLHFSDVVVITQYLSNHPSFKMDCFKRKEAVAELAAARFVNHYQVEMETMHLINDLQTGKDLPNFRKLGLPAMTWIQISRATE